MAKVLVKNISTVTLLGFRNFFAAALVWVYVLPFKDFKMIDAAYLPYVIVFSLLSSFIGFYLLFSALKNLEAAKAAAFRVLDPFFILIYAFLIFHAIP